MLRLFPDGIGHRDNLPYSPEFDEQHKRFTKLTGRRLSQHSFWRATSRVAKLSRKPKPLFDAAPLGGMPVEMVHYLERTNPWWRAQASQPIERYRRHAFYEIVRRLDARVAPIVAVRGPRRVGKTTIQLQLVEELLLIQHVAPQRILRVQFDETPALGSLVNPIEAVVRWYEQHVLKDTINGQAQRGQRCYLLFDEVQNLPGWSAQLKALVDHTDAHVLVTGSSALRIARGHDNLAGRISKIEMGPLHLSEIAGVRNLPDLPRFGCPNARDDWSRREFWLDLNSHARKHARGLGRAFGFFSELGGYPVCHKQAVTGSTSMLAAQLVEDVVNKSLDNDPVRVGARGQLDRGVIREVFRLLCRYAGQGVSRQELSRQISTVLGGGIKIRDLDEAAGFLEDAMLIHRVPPLEMLNKKQLSPPKNCLCDHFVRNAWLQEMIPIDPARLANLDPAVAGLAGHLVESIVGYQLHSVPFVEVAWFPPRPREDEIDFVLTLGVKRLPIEVKYQRAVGGSDAAAVDGFCSKSHYGADFGLIITQSHEGPVGTSAIAVPAAHLLLAI